MRANRSIRMVALLCALFGVALLVAGCASTFQTRGGAEVSPFLGDASQFREGSGDEAKLVYINPKADFRQYRKILLEPVAMVAGKPKSSTFSRMSKEDQQAVVNYLDAQIREKLGRDYTFVTGPGSDVMRLRVAITEAKGSTVVMDTLSSILPPAVALSLLKTVATGTGTAVGRAGVEMELKDSVTGERLAAAVDERAGRKYTFRLDKFSRYHAIESAFDYWTTRLQKRLLQMRSARQGT